MEKEKQKKQDLLDSRRISVMSYFGLASNQKPEASIFHLHKISRLYISTIFYHC